MRSRALATSTSIVPPLPILTVKPAALLFPTQYVAFIEAVIAMVSVPAVIVPFAQNYVINPSHKDAARIRVSRAARYTHAHGCSDKGRAASEAPLLHPRHRQRRRRPQRPQRHRPRHRVRQPLILNRKDVRVHAGRHRREQHDHVGRKRREVQKLCEQEGSRAGIASSLSAQITTMPSFSPLTSNRRD